MKSKKPKKRANKYEEKLAVNVPFEELVKISVTPSKTISKAFIKKSK